MTYRTAWITDIHFDMLTQQQIEDYLLQLDSLRVSSILLSGDIGEAPNVSTYLRQMADTLRIPIYFILGNHDYYGGAVTDVRLNVTDATRESSYLKYLVNESVIELTPSVGLIGHDGWADLQFGDFWRSSVWMRDYLEIKDLKNLPKGELYQEMQMLARESATHFRRVLPQALEKYSKVIALTHLPPFREACWHEGKISDDEWLPHFTNKVVGEVLAECMADHPNHQLIVLCGHTHGKGEARILPNLHVLTGGAEYGQTHVQQIITLE